jgi:hypothetical protein
MARTTGRAVCVLAGGLSHPSTEKAAADALIWATWPRSQSPAPADGEGTATTAIAGDGVPSGGGAGRVGWWKVSLQAPSTARAISRGPAPKNSCGWAQRAGSAQGTVPRALPASAATSGSFSRQPEAPACHPQRGRPASTGRADGHFPAKKRRWPAVLTPRVGRLRADDGVALAQSRGRRGAFDRGRSGPRMRHLQGSRGRFARVWNRDHSAFDGSWIAHHATAFDAFRQFLKTAGGLIYC